MTKYILFATIFFFSGALDVLAQEPPSATNTTNVFEQLAQPDSRSGAEVRFHQDNRIETLFIDRQLVGAGAEIPGWRVQVFSSNVQQTARAEAFRIKALVEARFPDLGVYESFSAPFWRVRVGDFRTREEAEEKRAELRRAFPAIQGEMVSVRDVIILR